MSGRPISLKWDPAKFSYGFHITRLVLTSASFLATIPLEARKCRWYEARLPAQRQPRVQRWRNTSRALWNPWELSSPVTVFPTDCLLTPLPSLPASGMRRPLKDSVRSALSSQRRMGKRIGRRTKAISSVWSGGGTAFGAVLGSIGPTWAGLSISRLLTIAPQVPSSLGNWLSRNKVGLN